MGPGEETLAKYTEGDTVTYGGMSLSKKGVFLSKQCLEQVWEMTAPKNIADLRSYLGTMNYQRSLLTDLENLTHHHHPLLKAAKNILS